MSDLDLIIRADRIVTDSGISAGSVSVRDGVIVGVGALDDGDAELVVELAADEVLMPGLVDTHVHINEPGRSEWEGFATATRAAGAGGVTTLVDMPLNSVPPTIDIDALDAKRRSAAGQCAVDVGFWGGAVPSSLGRLRPLWDAGVYGFKCFLLPSGVDEFPPLDIAQLDAAMSEVASFDGLLIVHAEDAATIERAPAATGNRYADFLASRPHEAEDRAIGHVIELAEKYGTRAHILHLSSADALGDIAAARTRGVRLTVETCPHYLSIDAARIPAGRTEFKCCPPIRDDANRDRLWQALGDGTIDFIVTDHSPSPPELKNFDRGDFGDAWGGVASLQVGFAVVWTEASRRGHELSDVVRWMSTRPAELVGVQGKGRIAVGYAADFAVVAPDETFTVEVGRLRYRHPITPYQGRELAGWVRATWLRGQPIGDGPPAGRLITRSALQRTKGPA
jgi:allantoinase